MMRTEMNLNEVVMCAINGVEVGDTKKEAVMSITSFVEANYINKATIQDLSNLSISEIEKLYEMGFEFHINDGKVAGLILRQGDVN